MTNQMDAKREMLNRLVENAETCHYSSEVIAASREMDQLITQYYKDLGNLEVLNDKAKWAETLN